MTLYEARHRLGGRACSFADPVSGLVLDNCQHVILGCCEAVIAFLRKIGSLDRVSFSDSIRMTTSRGRKLVLTSSRLPPPVHLLPSVVGSGYLTPVQKIALVRTLARISRREPADRASAAEYLRSLSCPPEVTDLVFRPFIVAVLNEEPELASADYARTAILKAMLGDKDSFMLGTTTSPLSETIAEPAELYLRFRGGEIRLGCPVDRVITSGDEVRSMVLRSGETVCADAYVVAVPPYALDDLGLPTAAGTILWRPILSAHLIFDGDPDDFQDTCVADEPFGWVFDKSSLLSDGRVCMQAVASAPGSIADDSKASLTELALRAVRAAIPQSREWRLVRSVICRNHRSTFSTAGGVDHLRPPQTTSFRNLFLAGDWTATGWPSTLESAVISGVSAAHGAMELR